MNTIMSKLGQIRCFILDLDGVLTDAGLYLDNEARESRRFNINDGLGLKLLKLIGFEIAVITGSAPRIVDKRMQQLGIEHYYTNCLHKVSAYQELKTKLKLEDSQIAFMGDDYQDIPLLEQVGLSIAPANAIAAVKSRVDICTKASGGHGAVREIAEFFIQSLGKEEDIINYFRNYPCISLEKAF